jgi:predicted MFS family arabinose efflux permease
MTNLKNKNRTIKPFILFIFPLMVDIIVGLTLFLGRHSLASQGYDEKAIASIMLCYGIGYVISSLLMMRIIRPRYVKAQMLAALGGMILVSIALANTQELFTMQVLYSIFPFLSSLFFNAFQIFMLGISNQNSRPLSTTIGHFTLAWSIGYAIGPFLSSQLVAAFDWSGAYYLASIVASLVAILLIGYKPGTNAPQESTSINQSKPDLPQSDRSLIIPAWIGLLLGWTVWNVVLIYWPVQAEHWQVIPNLRGLPEFSAAMAQGITALALTFVVGWLRKPSWIFALGIVGVSGLIFLGFLNKPDWFFIGTLLYGIYTGSMFSLVGYHSMQNEIKAVKRVAVNETLIGFSFLVAFPLSAWFHPVGSALNQSYFFLSILLGIGVVLQTIFISMITCERRPFKILAYSKKD